MDGDASRGEHRRRLERVAVGLVAVAHEDHGAPASGTIDGLTRADQSARNVGALPHRECAFADGVELIGNLPERTDTAEGNDVRSEGENLGGGLRIG